MELRIIPLAEANFAGLEELFDEQCDEWLELLKWNYSEPSRLICEIVRQRELAGFAVLKGDAVIGFSFYVVEENRCSIGDIYVSRAWRGLGADTQMARAILERLNALPRLRRIESQCVSIDNDGADRLFQARGFERFERLYLMVELDSLEEGNFQSRSRSGGNIELQDVIIRTWKEDDFAQAARVIHRSYKGEHDSRINSQYRTEDGCADLLAILTDYTWCGEFLPQASKVAVSGRTGKLVGMLIASRIATDTGHIGQISILPDHQGLGIGRRMIRASLSEFEHHGFESVSLAVTSANAGALHLYQSCGFRTAHQFPVFYRDRK